MKMQKLLDDLEELEDADYLKVYTMVCGYGRIVEDFENYLNDADDSELKDIAKMVKGLK